MTFWIAVFKLTLPFLVSISCFLRTEFMLVEKKTIKDQIKRLQEHANRAREVTYAMHEGVFG
jgi:hypothetical protein